MKKTETLADALKRYIVGVESYKAIAKKTGVPSDVTRKWNRQTPRTVNALKAMCFLTDEAGCAIEEFERLPEDIRALARRVAADERVIDRLLASGAWDSKEAVLRLFKPNATNCYSAAQQAVLQEIVGAASAQTVSAHTVDNHDVLMTGLVAQLRAIIPLAKTVTSTAFTPEERFQLRVKMMPGGEIGRIADLVNALTSEESLKELRSVGAERK